MLAFLQQYALTALVVVHAGIVLAVLSFFIRFLSQFTEYITPTPSKLYQLLGSQLFVS